MEPIHVFYFRGLNTAGKDDIRWSAFDVGPIHREFEKEFGRRGVQFHPVLGMGTGSWGEVTARARLALEKDPLWRDSSVPVHLLGHSAGGLVMRLLLQEGLGRERVLSATTLSSPHAGTKMANIWAEMPETSPLSSLVFTALGQKVARKKEIFRQLTPEVVKPLWTSTPRDLPLASVVTQAPKDKWCALLKFCHAMPALKDFTAVSDGIVEVESQPYGEVIAELEIDHFRTAGLFNDGPAFAKQCDVLCDYFKKARRES